MATVSIPGEDEGLQCSPEILGAGVKGNPSAGLRGAQSRDELDQAQTSGWCYWVPFPGVRYYCYGKPASTVGPVEQSGRQLPT